MQKVLGVNEAVDHARKLKEQGKTIVLAGGCFDILHIGHIRLLNQAKQHGDVLFVLLESDKTIQKLKGKHRPIHPQHIRAELLSSLKAVDYVIALPPLKSDNEYDELVFEIKPAIIATTKGDPAKEHKTRQAREVGAKVINVIDHIRDASTTRLARLLRSEL